jgi:hypothetical protein
MIGARRDVSAPLHSLELERARRIKCVEETAIVRDEHDGSREARDGRLEFLDRPRGRDGSSARRARARLRPAPRAARVTRAYARLGRVSQVGAGDSNGPYNDPRLGSPQRRRVPRGAALAAGEPEGAPLGVPADCPLLAWVDDLAAECLDARERLTDVSDSEVR